MNTVLLVLAMATLAVLLMALALHQSDAAYVTDCDSKSGGNKRPLWTIYGPSDHGLQQPLFVQCDHGKRVGCGTAKDLNAKTPEFTVCPDEYFLTSEVLLTCGKSALENRLYPNLLSADKDLTKVQQRLQKQLTAWNEQQDDKAVQAAIKATSSGGAKVKWVMVRRGDRMEKEDVLEEPKFKQVPKDWMSAARLFVSGQTESKGDTCPEKKNVDQKLK